MSPTPDGYISAEDYNSWLQHPVTRAVSTARRTTIRFLEEFLGNGGTVDAENVATTALNTTINVGYIKGLREALNPPDYLHQGEADDTYEED